eukprot:c30779_g1_i1 orf=250-441(+)
MCCVLLQPNVRVIKVNAYEKVIASGKVHASEKQDWEVIVLKMIFSDRMRSDMRQIYRKRQRER